MPNKHSANRNFEAIPPADAKGYDSNKTGPSPAEQGASKSPREGN
jgi:hypothetical protein